MRLKKKKRWGAFCHSLVYRGAGVIGLAASDVLLNLATQALTKKEK